MSIIYDENGVLSDVSLVNGSFVIAHDADQVKRDRYNLQNVAASFLRPFSNLDRLLISHVDLF